jgi:hypothetical protein
VLGGLAAATAVTVLPVGWARTAAAALRQGSSDPVTSLLRAYVSTLVPGPADDPLGTPGGVEAGGVEAIVANAPYVVPLLTADLTAAALATHGTDFASLAYPQREAILVAAFADVRAPYHLIALALGAGAFYGDFSTDVGSRHLGVPSTSRGYLTTYTDRTGHGQPQTDALTP